MRHGRTLAWLAIAVAGCGNVGRSTHGSDGGFNSGGDMSASCVGLQCQVMSCGETGTPTTLVGKVYAPNGTLALYNAIVFVPNAPLDPFDQGVSCDRCDGQVSGMPLAQALTGPDGSFKLENVPAGQQIPLVVQVGKWRRMSFVDVPPCTTTAVAANDSRLPRNKTEGDMPHMAIATGGADPFECLLLKIGIDSKEIQEPGHNARVDFYQAAGSAGTAISSNTPVADDPQNGLYTKMSKLMTYDVVMLPCEGSEYDGSNSTSTGQTTYGPNIANYVNMGGRVFATHYSYSWLTWTNSPFNKVANPQMNGLWPKDQSDSADDTTPWPTKLVTTFPKGMAFSQWLHFVGVSSAPQTLNIYSMRHDINGVDPRYAQAWATDFGADCSSGTCVSDGVPGVAHLTFNTPLDAPLDDGGVPQYCGRVVFSDFHVASSEVNFGTDFPAACVSGPLTDQEKALAFMLFDLSSCVQSDQQPPVG